MSEKIEQIIIRTQLNKLMKDLVSCGDTVEDLKEILATQVLQFVTVEINNKLQYISFAAERVLDKLETLKMDSSVFKKRSRETWTTECEWCTGGQHKIKRNKKMFCMKCDRPSDGLKCYLIREGLKFVWKPKLRFHGHVYFEQNLQKINMPGLIYHKNDLLKRLKPCKIMCTEHSKVTMVMCGKKTFAFTMQVKYGRLDVTLHCDAVVDGYKLLVTKNHSSDHNVQWTEEELCTLLTNIDLNYPNIVKTPQYQAEDGQ